MSNLKTSSWGMKPFDQSSGGIPANLMSVIETPDYHVGNIILGHYIYEGLKKGERCALVTFDSAESFLENFASWDLDFTKYLNNEQFILLNYQPNISYEAGLSHDFDSIFSEIKTLCKDEAPSRIAFQQVDTMVNLNNQVLMNTSAQKLSAVARGSLTKGTSILGQFVQFNDTTHQNLSIAFQKTMHGYFKVVQQDELSPSKFEFYTKKLPWFGYSRKSTPIILREGEGFLNDDIQRTKVA